MGSQIVIELSERLDYAKGHGYQLSISELDENGNGHGYRIFGPKYGGGPSKRLRKVVLTERDAREIGSYLAEVGVAEEVSHG